MNDLQIGRNLGAMFESAARHLTFENGSSSVTLPPSVATFINTNYYNSKTVFSVNEMIKVLESSNEGEVYTVLKYIVSIMFGSGEKNGSGVISTLYPHIMKKVTSNNIKIKRLVYAIIEAKSKEFQDETLLSINAIQKSLNDSNAIIRSLAIRCLSGIEIPAILPIVLLSLRKCVVDSSPLVRSASCIAILKCYRLDKRSDDEVRSQLNEYLDMLLSDDDAKVLGTAICVYREVMYGNFDIIHNKFEHIVKHLQDFETDAFIDAVEVLCNYLELFGGSKGVAQVMAQIEERIEFEQDVAVVLSCVHVLSSLYHTADRQDKDRVLAKALLRVIHECSGGAGSGQLCTLLECVYVLVMRNGVEFTRSEATQFVPSPCDEPRVFVAKCRVYFALQWEWRIVAALLDTRGLSSVCMRALLEGATAAVARDGDTESRNALLDTYTKRMGVSAGVEAETGIIDAECVSGVRALVQENVAGHAGLLARLSARVTESDGGTDTARASIVWLLGEFAITDNTVDESEEAATLRAALPDIVRLLAAKFKNEGPHTRLAILVCATKTLVAVASANRKQARDAEDVLRSRVFKVHCYVHALASRDGSVDIRDVARVLSSVTPCVPYTGGGTWSVETALEMDSALRARCVEQCTNVDLAFLLLQVEKRVGLASDESEEDTLSKAVCQFWNKRHNTPDPAYEDYYRELRNGLVVRDYAVHGSGKGELTVALSFSGASASASASPTASPTLSTGFNTVKKSLHLQSLDEFLQGD